MSSLSSWPDRSWRRPSCSSPTSACGTCAIPLGTTFVGLKNYLQLFGDGKFWTSLFNTAYFVVVGVPLTLVLGLAAALALDRGIDRFRTVFRVGYYLPVVTSIVAIAVVWRFVLDPDLGPRQHGPRPLGIKGPDWLANPVLAMPSIIAMAAWRNLGFAMVVFIAGLQAIPRSLYEAAAIDGAGKAGRRSGTSPCRCCARRSCSSSSSRRSATSSCSRSRS